MHSRAIVLRFLAAGSIGFALVGCGERKSNVTNSTEADAAGHGDAAEHANPHDVPITEADVEMPADYSAALARIEGYRDTIRTEASGDVPERAHRPLDELDIVLAKLTEIARDSGVPKESWEEVNTASRELRDLFNTIHADIDAGAKPDYDAVAEGIDKTIARLGAVPAGGESDAGAQGENTP